MPRGTATGRRSRSTSSSPTRLARGRLRAHRGHPPRPSRQCASCRAIRSRRTRTSTSRRTPFESRGLLHCEIKLGARGADAPLHQRPPRPLRARPAAADPGALRPDPRDRADGCAARDRRRLQRLAAQGEPRRWSTSSACTRYSSPSAAARRARFPRSCRCSASIASTRAASRSATRTSTTRYRSGRACPTTRRSRPPSIPPGVRDDAVRPRQPRRAPAQRRRVLPGARRRDRPRASARSGSRPTSSPTTMPAASSRQRSRGRRRAVSRCGCMVDGWGARHYLTRSLESALIRRRRHAAQVPARSGAVAVPLAPAAAAAPQARATSMAGSRSSAASTSSTTSTRPASGRRASTSRSASKVRSSGPIVRTMQRVWAINELMQFQSSEVPLFPEPPRVAARRRADREVRASRQPAPSPRHRERIPRGDPHARRRRS